MEKSFETTNNAFHFSVISSGS